MRASSEPPTGPPRPTICLAMIARDEAHIIEETLASVAPHIDTFVVVDTGSTDDTIGTVRRFFDAAGIDGEVVERPWRDFGTNRTEALALARNRADYTLMMDADDLLVGEPSDDPLTADAYDLRSTGAMAYSRTLLFRNARHWSYRGVVHEYPHSLDGPTEVEPLERDWSIESRSLGNRSRDPDRFVRDAELLEAAFATDPDDPRTAFYVAESYRNAGELEQALTWYERRITMPGWDQETFWAMLQRARVLARLERSPGDLLAAFLGCWQFRTLRAEPLHDLAAIYRTEGAFDLGYLFARRASEIPFPREERLFVEREVYTWRIVDTLAVCAFYVGRQQESFDLCERLLGGDDLPPGQRDRVASNRDLARPFIDRSPTRPAGDEDEDEDEDED